jgi:hypothetical protein
MFAGVLLLSDEAEEPLFGLVVGAVRNPLKLVLVKHPLRLRFLGWDSIKLI